MEIEVRIRGILVDPSTNMPIVVLKDIASDQVMPIWIGSFEANAIAFEMEKVATPRPMAHDLVQKLIQYLNGELERVVIAEIRGDTYVASLWIRQNDTIIFVDARPSDAIALALRADCPIFVDEAVMRTARLQASGQGASQTADQLKHWLEGLGDDDLGQYKM